MEVSITDKRLIIEDHTKWSPMQGLLFGAIAGTVIGIVSEEVAAGISVFLLVGIAGSSLTLYETLSRFRYLSIDFERKELIAKKIFMNRTFSTLSIKSFEITKFYFTDYDGRKEFFRKYWLHYVDDGKSHTLGLIPGQDTLTDITILFKSNGFEPPLKAEKLGEFLASR